MKKRKKKYLWFYIILGYLYHNITSIYLFNYQTFLTLILSPFLLPILLPTTSPPSLSSFLPFLLSSPFRSDVQVLWNYCAKHLSLDLLHKETVTKDFFLFLNELNMFWKSDKPSNKKKKKSPKKYFFWVPFL